MALTPPIRRLRLAAIAGAFVALIIVAASGAQATRIAVAHVQRAPSLFGIDTSILDSNHSNVKKDFSRAGQLGGRWVHFTGDAIHWRGGHPDYSLLDSQVGLAKAHGLGILISLGGDSQACSVHPKPPNPSRCPPTTAADLQVYKKFLEQELLRYRSEVTYYESWVSPNQPGRWPPQPNAAQYAKLLEAQYSVFQAVNKAHGLHLKLLFGGSMNFSIAPGSASQGGIAVLPFTHAVLADLGGGW